MAQFKGALKPNAEIHDTYIDIEPLTGAPFRIAERLQLNMVCVGVTTSVGTPILSAIVSFNESNFSNQVIAPVDFEPWLSFLERNV